MVIDTGAANLTIGAVMSKVGEGQEKILCNGSATLSATERNYCVTMRGLLALVRFTSRFRQYLLCRPFTLRTNHRSLLWPANLQDRKGRLARWFDKQASCIATQSHSRDDPMVSNVPVR